MEPLTIFALTLGLICAFHLVSTVVNRFGKGIYNYGPQKKKRDDWFCFFKTSTLLGENRETENDVNNQQSTTVRSENLEQRRKQQARRPRIHA
jgi:hypothetical protein